MTIQYQLVATKPNGQVVFWNYRGFTESEEHSAKMISLDFADLTATMEHRTHPTWDFKLRIREVE